MRSLHRSTFDNDDHGPTLLKAWMRRNYDRDYRGSPVPYRHIHNLLKTSTGKVWNDIHSKLSQRWSHRSRTGWLIWRYINGNVETTCFVADGKVWGDSRWYRFDHFVHPQTGILHTTPREKRVYPPDPPPDRLRVNPTQVLIRVEGIWYLETTTTRWQTWRYPTQVWGPTEVPAAPYQRVCYALLPYQVAWVIVSRTEKHVETTKEQLNRSELRFYKLHNTVTIRKIPRRHLRAIRK